jgi:SAM-dependent methyltransferase
LTGKTSLLDLGAGPGQHSLFFQERGLEMVSIDLSFEMCRLNREKGIAVAQMNLCQFGLKPDAFGAVWSLNCLLHLPKNEMPGVLENIRDILVPEGIFFWDFTAGKILKAFGQMILINPGVFFHSSPIRKFRYL